MTKPHYKPTLVMGMLLVVLTFTTLPAQAGELTSFFIEIGKQLLQDVVVEYGKQMIQDNLTKEANNYMDWWTNKHLPILPGLDQVKFQSLNFKDN
jgi:hypothetical protein